jgi:predicted Zn-dependent protease
MQWTRVMFRGAIAASSSAAIVAAGAVLALALFATLHAECIAASAKQIIAIQPLETFDAKPIDSVKQQLIANYGVDVIIKPACPLPQEAYYPKRNRYRAEKLLDYLDRINGTSTKVLGLTSVDILTTKGIHQDWGILGQGQMNGRPCVVSAFRMKGTTKKVSEDVFRSRFAKVVALGITVTRTGWIIARIPDASSKTPKEQ